MACRHLSRDCDMLRDTLRGRITSDDKGDVILVVDGLAVEMDQLTRFLSTHEGWEFEFKIRDALE